MSRRVRRLFDMDVDEISTVDRAANQHAAIAFSKRAGAEEATMPTDLYDAEGVEVFEDELESGDIVYDDDGEEFVYVAEEDAEEFGIDPEQLELEYEDEGELVGKAGIGAWRKGISAYATDAGERLAGGYQAGRAISRGPAKLTPEEANFSSNVSRANAPVKSAQAYLANPETGRVGRFGGFVGRNRNALIGGGAGVGAAGAGGAGYGVYRRTRKNRPGSKPVGKSLVYDELAEALDNADTSVAIAKMADYVESARAEAEEANQRAQAIEDSFSEAEYVHKAADYSLPVAPQALGSVLHRASQVLSKRDLAVLDQALSAAGELGYDEIGTAGGAQPEIMYEVEAYADRLVGKSDLSREEAVVAMFEANPAAYDEYLAEQNGR